MSDIWIVRFRWNRAGTARWSPWIGPFMFQTHAIKWAKLHKPRKPGNRAYAYEVDCVRPTDWWSL